jgi:hypothetical protein
MDEKLKYKIRNAVDKLGLEQSLSLFGKDILKQTYIDNPESYLDNFKNLELRELHGMFEYSDKDNEIIFYGSKDIDAFSDCIRIRPIMYRFFLDVLSYNVDDIRSFIKKWLKVNYDIDHSVLILVPTIVPPNQITPTDLY